MKTEKNLAAARALINEIREKISSPGGYSHRGVAWTWDAGRLDRHDDADGSWSTCGHGTLHHCAAVVAEAVAQTIPAAGEDDSLLFYVKNIIDGSGE